MLADAYVVDYINGSDLSEDGRSCITTDRGFATVPDLLVFRRYLLSESLLVQSIIVNFTFLNAQDEWLDFLHEFLQNVTFEH